MADVNRLTAVLAAGNRGNNLCHNGTRNLEALRTLNQLSVHDRSILKHITDVDQTAVKNALQIIIHIMEMDHTILMCLNDLLRQEDTLGQIL